MNNRARALLLAVTFAALPSASAQPFRLTLKNCGQTLTFRQMPKRVVSMYSVTTELMLRLGLGDRLVAAANFGETLPADLQVPYRKLNLIGKDFAVPREVLLSQRPDLVLDNQPDYFYDPKHGFATQAELRAGGAQAYSITAKCQGVQARFEDIYTDISNMGKLFGVEGRAQALIRSMSGRVAGVRTRIAGRAPLKVMIYDAGEGPLGLFGPGTYDSVLKLAGGVNAFADLKESYAQVGVEAVASRSDIDIFIVADYDKTGPARVAFLKKTFPNSRAVRNNRVYLIDYGLMNPGVRNDLGVEAFARALYPEAFRK